MELCDLFRNTKSRCYITDKSLKHPDYVGLEFARNEFVYVHKDLFRKKPLHKIMRFIRDRLRYDPEITRERCKVYPTGRLIRDYRKQKY